MYLLLRASIAALAVLLTFEVSAQATTHPEKPPTAPTDCDNRELNPGESQTSSTFSSPTTAGRLIAQRNTTKLTARLQSPPQLIQGPTWFVHAADAWRPLSDVLSDVREIQTKVGSIGVTGAIRDSYRSLRQLHVRVELKDATGAMQRLCVFVNRAPDLDPVVAVFNNSVTEKTK